MKLRKPTPALVTPTNATLRGMLSKTWHAEKRGGVWEVESPEFEEVVKLALDEREKLEEAKARSEAADNAVRQLASRVAEDDHSDIDMSGYGFNVKVKRRSQYRWDSAKLAEIFAQSNTLPNHVKKSLSVDRRTYERLSSDEQSELRPALTVISQKSAINISRSQ